MSATAETQAHDELLDLSVVVPTRNAEAFLEACLTSIVASRPREIIVVDGHSEDRTVAIARAHGARVLSDAGRGVAAARIQGTAAAVAPLVALIDADVILPPGALRALRQEFRSGGYTALQAGLESISGPGYWGNALAHHHRTGRSKHWFGLVATIFERDALLRHGMDEDFKSGEDIELRHRLEAAGARIGVSRTTTVVHRFGDGFAFAMGQFLADGRGHAATVAKHGLPVAWLLGLPLAAAFRGTFLSLLRREPRWVPYYGTFLVFNYVGMAREFLARLGARSGSRRAATQ